MIQTDGGISFVALSWVFDNIANSRPSTIVTMTGNLEVFVPNRRNSKRSSFYSRMAGSNEGGQDGFYGHQSAHPHTNTIDPQSTLYCHSCYEPNTLQCRRCGTPLLQIRGSTSPPAGGTGGLRLDPTGNGQNEGDISPISFNVDSQLSVFPMGNPCTSEVHLSNVPLGDSAAHLTSESKMSIESASPEPEWKKDPKVFPEGGAAAWLTVAGSSACLFVSFGWVNCVGVFQDYYQLHQLKDYTASEIAWIPSLQSTSHLSFARMKLILVPVFFMVFMGLFIGKVFDDYGPRPLLIVGTFLHVFGLMMASISEEYYQILLSQAVCSAIGSSMVFYPAFSCVSTWFLAKRGAALGLVAAGSSLGGVIFPIMLIHLIPKIGFGWAMRTCAFMILALLIFAIFTVKSRLEPSKRPFKVLAFVKPLTEPAFILLTAAVFFFYCEIYLFFFSFNVIRRQTNWIRGNVHSAHLYCCQSSCARNVRDIGQLSGPHSQRCKVCQFLICRWHLVLIGISVIGRTVPNALADKLGHYNVMIVMCTATTALILGLWLLASSNLANIIFAAFFGVSSGAGIGLTPALVAKISPLPEIGARTGAAMSISAFAALTGSPIGGQIISVSHGSFQNTIIFGGVSCAIGTALFLATRLMIAGPSTPKM